MNTPVSGIKFPTHYFCSNCYWWEHQLHSPGKCLYYKENRDWNQDATQCVHWVSTDSYSFRGD